MKHLGILFVALAGLVMAPGCKPKAAPKGGPGGAPGGMAVQVVAILVREKPVIEVVPLVGSIAANEFVEIKSEADGLVAEIGFEEGQRVKKGSMMLTLDESKFTASLHEAEASQKLAEANFARAKQLSVEKLPPRSP